MSPRRPKTRAFTEHSPLVLARVIEATRQQIPIEAVEQRIRKKKEEQKKKGSDDPSLDLENPRRLQERERKLETEIQREFETVLEGSGHGSAIEIDRDTRFSAIGLTALPLGWADLVFEWEKTLRDYIRVPDNLDWLYALPQEHPDTLESLTVEEVVNIIISPNLMRELRQGNHPQHYKPQSQQVATL